MKVLNTLITIAGTWHAQRPIRLSTTRPIKSSTQYIFPYVLIGIETELEENTMK